VRSGSPENKIFSVERKPHPLQYSEERLQATVCSGKIFF
jgi:hypothetical protein